MGKISLQSPSVGDSITAAGLNEDLKSFSDESSQIGDVNLRPQGLDIHSFKRGVMSHGRHYSQAVTGPLYLNQVTTHDLSPLPPPITHAIGGCFYSVASMGMSPDFEKFDFIFRCSFPCFLSWHKNGDVTTFDGSTSQGYIYLTATIKITGSYNGVGFSEELPWLTREIVYVQDDLAKMPSWSGSVTISSVLTPEDIPTMKQNNWTKLDSMSFQVYIRQVVVQHVQNPMKVSIQVLDGQAYITQYRK
jgi:hypothetical protein